MWAWPVSFWPKKREQRMEDARGVHVSPNEYTETWSEFLRRIAKDWMRPVDHDKLLKLADKLEDLNV